MFYHFFFFKYLMYSSLLIFFSFSPLSTFLGDSTFSTFVGDLTFSLFSYLVVFTLFFDVVSAFSFSFRLPVVFTKFELFIVLSFPLLLLIPPFFSDSSLFSSFTLFSLYFYFYFYFGFSSASGSPPPFISSSSDRLSSCWNVSGLRR